MMSNRKHCFLRPEDLQSVNGVSYQCSLCKTCVVDLTGKSDVEIINYLQQNKGQKICAITKEKRPYRPAAYMRSFKNDLIRSVKLYNGRKMVFRILFITMTLGIISCRTRRVGIIGHDHYLNPHQDKEQNDEKE